MTFDRIVVVGGSLAGLRAAQALRDSGFDQSLTVIGEETAAPYNRPPLSKAVLSGDLGMADLVFAVPDSLDIAWRRGTRAVGLDVANRAVTLAGGETVGWDGLVIATGAKARIPALPGVALAGVHYLRTYDDANALKASLRPGARLAIIGAGFIGCEIAASARGLGVAVSLVDPAQTPMSRILSPELGAMVAGLHRSHGVDLRLGQSVSAILGGDHVEGVLLASGETVAADAVVIGVGSVPAIDWLKDSGLPLADGVLCDETCRVLGGGGRVVAAGDVANWPHQGYGGSRMRVEHWTQAGEQAAAAAAALLDPLWTTPYRPVLSLWSDQYERKLQVLGAPWLGSRTEIAEGALSAEKFLAVSWDGARLMGVVAMGMPGKLAGYRAQIIAAMTPAPSHVASQGVFV